MLQLTEPAAFVVDELRRQRQIPGHYGLRIFQPSIDDGPAGMRLKFADSPASTDVVVEQHDTTLFVAAEVAAKLADQMLDVETNAPSNGPPSPSLVLRPQSQPR